MIKTMQGMRDANETAREAKHACERIVREWARTDGSWVPEVVSWGMQEDDLIIVTRTLTQQVSMLRVPMVFIEMADADLRQAFIKKAAKAWRGTQKITQQ